VKKKKKSTLFLSFVFPLGFLFASASASRRQSMPLLLLLLCRRCLTLAFTLVSRPGDIQPQNKNNKLTNHSREKKNHHLPLFLLPPPPPPPPTKTQVPRQRRCQEALTIINSTLDGLIAECQRLVDSGEEEFVDEFLSDRDPSILHFLLAAGDTLDSKQLRDDLMTLLVAGHETTAAVLTWTVYCLISRPEYAAKVAKEVDEVLGVSF